jgi:uncharacterized protein YkwD
MRDRGSRLLCVALGGAFVLAAVGCFGGDDDDDVAGGACDASGEGYWEAESAELECQVLELVNEHRAAGADCGSYGSYGATEPLTMQDQLREAARFHSQWMAQTDTFSHDSPGGPNGDTWIERIENAGYTGYSTIAENIAAGSATAEGVVQQWMESDGHCSNIMEPAFNEIGVGYFYAQGNTYGHYWTQDFGAR